MFIYVLEKWGGREREGEKHQCARYTNQLPLTHPNWGPGLQPRHMPWLGIYPANLWFTGWHSIHWATSARTKVGMLISLKVLDEGCTPAHQWQSALKSWGLTVVFLSMGYQSLSDLDVSEEGRQKPRPAAWNKGLEFVVTLEIFPSCSKMLIDIICSTPPFIG